MKKAVFMVIISLALQGFSQVKSGVYETKKTLDFEWVEGKQVGETYVYGKSLLLHITETGFRVYKKHTDTGKSFPFIYIGITSEGYYAYAVPFGDRFEMKDDLAVLFYNFNNETGWYQNSTEYRDLEYLRKHPDLSIKE